MPLVLRDGIDVARHGGLMMVATTNACPDRNEGDLFGDRLCIDRIRRAVETDHIGGQFYLFWEVTSTNDVLRRLERHGAREGTVVLAETQTNGRACPGRRAGSPPAVNFYASTLFRPRIPVDAVPVFSFIASLALTDAMWTEGVSAAVRWPNDVLIDGRTVGTTLVTYSVVGDHLDSVILGVDVNLNVQQHQLSTALGKAAAEATSLREAAGHLIDRNRFAAAYLNAVDKWLRLYQEVGAEVVLRAWRARDALVGRRVAVCIQDKVQRADVLGVNQRGCLVVETDDGIPHEIVSGEIRLAGRLVA